VDARRWVATTWTRAGSGSASQSTSPPLTAAPRRTFSRPSTATTSLPVVDSENARSSPA